MDWTWNYPATQNERGAIFYPKSDRGWPTFSSSRALAIQNLVSQFPRALGDQHGYSSAVRFDSYSYRAMLENYGW